MVFSQNTAYHFHGENYDTEGNGVVIHYGPDKPTRNVWIIGNTFSDITDAGIQVGGAVTFPTYLVGNGKASDVCKIFLDSIPEGGSIAVDYLGRMRQADLWDIGAFRYSAFKKIKQAWVSRLPVQRSVLHFPS